MDPTDKSNLLFTQITVDSSQVSDSGYGHLNSSIYLPEGNESIGLSTAEIGQERFWNELSSLYSANESLKGDAAALNTSTAKDFSGGGETAQKLDDLLDNFMDGSNTLLEELSVLGNAHPILALAIFAFHEVVKLDISRRDNNKKVLVVVLHMQSMLGPMFQLRNLDHTHMPDAERQFHETRLKDLVEAITQDIKICRSDITHFMNRKFVYKLVLAKGYEKKFASHIQTFSMRRSELQSVISEYLAIGVSTSNIAIAAVGCKVDVIDRKIDVIFRTLDTQRERDVFKFIQQNGGPEKCVNDLDLLPKLISKAGESPKTGKVAIATQTELEDLQKALREALNEDLDKVLQKHFFRFEKVLQVQSNNMKRMSEHLEDQGVLMQTHTTKLGKILDTVTTIMVLEEGKFRTKEIKLKDPEIQRVWQQMNLTSSSVKAKVFVLTFRDHIRLENSTAATPMPSFTPLPGADAYPKTLEPLSLNGYVSRESDEWVLEYIDVAYVQPIVEAMDEDGSGFISVKEANNFALSRPKGISLLHWIAYWAAGWHINITQHQKEIYAILLQMHEALPEIHVANRTYVDDYLDAKVMTRVEALLRSIRALPDTARKDHKLLEIANMVSSSHLDRLQMNLKDMGYAIESGLDATTIAGGGRVETWILPLLLLLLRRHLDIITLAKTHVLDPTEFWAHLESLRSIFSVFDERIENLEAKFRQLHRDIDAQFHRFSYGMFYVAFTKSEFKTSENTLLTLKLDEYATSNDVGPSQNPDISILSKPLGIPFDVEEINLAPQDPPPTDHVAHPMEGEWFGWFKTPTGRCYLRPYRCVVHPIMDGKLIGKGEAFFGSVDLVGTVQSRHPASTDPDLTIEFELTAANTLYDPAVCEGSYNAAKDTIEGTFTWKGEEFEEASEPGVDANNQDFGAAILEPATGPNANPAPVTQEFDEDGNQSSQTAAEGIRAEDLDQLRASSVDDIPTVEQVSVDDPTVCASNVEDSDNVLGFVSEETSERLESTPETASSHDSDNVDNSTTNPSNTGDGQEKVGEIVVTDEKKGDGRFYLTRTHPHLFRFRYLLDGIGTPPCWHVWPLARKRWAFAIEAILFETRTRMNSAKLFKAALAERRQWMYYAIFFDLTDSSITPRWESFESPTDKDWEVYERLLSTERPSTARIREEMAHYMARRQTYIVGRIFCDGCYKLIAFSRHQCIICMDDDLADYIDLCQNCFDKPTPVRSGNNKFSHTMSHSLLRSQHRIHVSEVNTLIPQARLISERCKKMFRDLEEKKNLTDVRHTRRVVKGKGARNGNPDLNVANQPAAASITPVLCFCCNEAVSLPCWVCVICSPLRFICDRCERRNGPNHHERDHHLLRIHDNVEVKPVRLDKISDVERQLEDIHSSISALDKKINMQIEEGKEIKGAVEEVAKTVGVKDYDLLSTTTEGSFIVEEMALEAAALAADMKAVDAPNISDSTDSEGDDSTDRAESPAPQVHETSKKSVSDLGERLGLLETKVENMNKTLTTPAQDDKYVVLAAKMDALEAKIDQQLGVLLALVQNINSTVTPTNS